jgi:NAD(P)H-hydrate epimerase
MRLPLQLLKRRPNSHKGDFGHVFILAGSTGFTGAGILAGRSSLRAGAGLVTIGVPESLLEVFEKQVVEVMTLGLPETKEGSLSPKALAKINQFLKKAEVLALGPGLSFNPSTQTLVRRIVASCTLPMVIDADALSALAGHLRLLRETKGERRRTRVITPHPGEMARLIKKPVSYIQANRKKAALDFAKKFGVNIILKGHHSVVASSYGKVYINKSGNPGMATAGSGDCLTGIVAAFLAQGLDCFSAAKYAAFIHGLAGDLAVKEKGELGLIASDIVEKIPEAIKRSSK